MGVSATAGVDRAPVGPGHLRGPHTVDGPTRTLIACYTDVGTTGPHHFSARGDDITRAAGNRRPPRSELYPPDWGVARVTASDFGSRGPTESVTPRANGPRRCGSGGTPTLPAPERTRARADSPAAPTRRRPASPPYDQRPEDRAPHHLSRWLSGSGCALLLSAPTSAGPRVVWVGEMQCTRLAGRSKGAWSRSG